MIEAGGILNDDGAGTVKAGASLDIVGTLYIAESGSLDVYGATVLEASAVYQPLGPVIARSGGYVGQPIPPLIISELVDQAVAVGEQVTFAVSRQWRAGSHRAVAGELERWGPLQ